MNALASLGASALLAAAVAASTAASAQTYDTPPPPAAPRPLTIAAPSEATLPNGLRIVVAHRPGVPLVSSALVVLSGAEGDPAPLSGLSAMTAGLLTQGTRHHSAPELAAAAEALGGSLESGAGWNQAVVSITVTTPQLDAALGLVAEVAREPVFAPEEIDRMRIQSLDGLKVAYANPGSIAGLSVARLVYGDSPWGHPANGTPASLPRIGRADLVAFHKNAYRPDRAVLILSGDIDADAAMALAKKHFGGWRAPADAVAAPPAVPRAAATAPLTVIDMAGSGQAGVALALPLPARQGSDWATSAVLDALLGSGYSSRLNAEIRIKRGLSYGAGSRIEPRRDSGLFVVSVQTKNESAAEVVKLVQAEVDRVAQAPAEAAELSARKTTLIGDFSRRVETTAGLADAIRGLLASGRSPAELTTRIESLGAVSPADVQRYAADHLGAAQRRIVVAGVASDFVPALKADGLQPDVMPLGSLDLDRGAGLRRP